MDDKKNTKKDEARASLPTDLQLVFDELVADYRFATIQHYRQPFVSYPVLADLVRIGWRCVVNKE